MDAQACRVDGEVGRVGDRLQQVALRGDRWFLGKIYYYPDPGWHFGVPFANYCGWAVVGLISLAIYFPLDRRLPAPEIRPAASVTPRILLGIGLYYGVLAFNLAMTFWIGESFMGLSGLLMHLPVCLLLASRLLVTLLASATGTCAPYRRYHDRPTDPGTARSAAGRAGFNCFFSWLN